MTTPSDPAGGQRDLDKVVTRLAALSMATGAALLASIRQVNPSVEFRFSVFSVVAFLGAGVFTIAFFRMRPANVVAGQVPVIRFRRRLILFSVAGAAAMIVSVAIALRNVSHEKQMDIAVGAAIAVVVLGLVGCLWWRVVRFLEADERREEERAGKEGK